MRESTAMLMPSYSNTGAENTYKAELHTIIDWVSITFKFEYFESVFKDILKLDANSFINVDAGINGYTQSLQRADLIKVYYHPEQSQMGVFLMLSGKACRYFETILLKQNRNWTDFLKECLLWDGHFTRVDIAIDDYKPYIQLKEVWKKVETTEIISKFKYARYVEEKSLANGKSNGITIYFGSNYSRQMIRFYEKGKQQMKTIKSELDLQYLTELYDCNAITEETIGFVDLSQNPYYRELDATLYSNWNRYELVCKKENARKAVSYICNGYPLGKLAVGILSDYIRITVMGKDSNRSRWHIWEPWSDLVQDTETVNISMKPEEKTIYDKELWIRKSVAPTLKVFQKYLDAVGFDGDLSLQSIIEQTALNKKQDIFLQKALKKIAYERKNTEIQKKNPLIKDSVKSSEN